MSRTFSDDVHRGFCAWPEQKVGSLDDPDSKNVSWVYELLMNCSSTEPRIQTGLTVFGLTGATCDTRVQLRRERRSDGSSCENKRSCEVHEEHSRWPARPNRLKSG